MGSSWARSDRIALQQRVFRFGRRGLHVGLLVLAMATLVYLIWTVLINVTQSYDGFSFDYLDGTVTWVAINGPASGSIYPGDIVFSLENRPVPNADPIYNARKVGDTVSVELVRGGKLIKRSLVLEGLPPSQVIYLLAPLLTAFLFWAVGVGALVLRNSDPAAPRLFLLFQLCCLMIVSGSQSARGPAWTLNAFGASLAMIGPAAIYFHLNFPWRLQFRGSSGFTVLLIALGLLGASPYVLFHSSDLIVKSWFPEYRLALRLLIACQVAASVLILLYSYRRATESAVRGTIRVVVLGSLLGVMPLAVLTILPESFSRQPLVPYPVALLTVGLLPLSYAHAISRGGLIQTDREISRFATQFLVLGLLTGSYLVGSSLVLEILPVEILDNPIALTALILVFAAAYAPLCRLIRAGLDFLFYGTTYNFRMLVRGASRELQQVENLSEINQSILDVLQIMRFPAAATFVLRERELILQNRYGDWIPADIPSRLSIDGAICRYLRHAARPCWREELSGALNGKSLSLHERRLITHGPQSLIVPVLSRGALNAVLIVWPMWETDWITGEDLDILAILATMAGISIENIGLVQVLRKHLEVIAGAREQLLLSRDRLVAGRDAERRHLARELHDGPIQILHAIRLRLGLIREKPDLADLAQVQEDVVTAIHQLRYLCNRLRPPALEYFGLEAAIRADLRRFVTDYPDVHISMDLHGDASDLSGDIQLAVYRIIQECLSNIGRHAAATQVAISIVVRSNFLELAVRDNGVGFSPPASWMEFASRGHMGILGISERVEALGGRLEIRSVPGRGTSIRAIFTSDELEADPDMDKDHAGRRLR